LSIILTIWTICAIIRATSQREEKPVKIATVVFVALGLVAGLMATLTAVHALPDFLGTSSGFSSTFMTTVFWTCLAGLFMLSAISLGIIADKILPGDSAA
jgi:hypothetical protein